MRRLLVFAFVVGCASSGSSTSPSPPSPPSPPPPIPTQAAASEPPPLASAEPPLAPPTRATIEALANDAALVDAHEGVAVVIVGPSYDLHRDTKTVRIAKRMCGPTASSRAQQELRVALRNIRSDDDLVCEDLACVHEASGEWDSQERIELARNGDRYVVVAIERVLDVPMRPGADADFAWARRQREKLANQPCH